MQPARLRVAGFTVIELVIVMVLIAATSAVVALKFDAFTKHKALVQADQLRRDLTHMQLLAISQSARLRLAVTSGVGYTVTYVACPTGTCTVGNTVTDPSTGQPFTATASSGVTITPASATLDIDSLGRPLAGTSLSTASQTFLVTGGSRSASVTVTPLTGFASVSY